MELAFATEIAAGDEVVKGVTFKISAIDAPREDQSLQFAQPASGKARANTQRP